MKYSLGISTSTLLILWAAWFAPTSFPGGLPTDFNDQSTVENFTANSFLNCPVKCNVADSLILDSLYDSTGGNIPTWNNFWFSSNPVCSWYGITVNNPSGFVEKIELNSNGMVGTLPVSIGNGNLSRVKLFQINNNDIGGTLPPGLGNMTKVETFWIDDNQFTGEVPATFGGMTNLVSFFLDNNQLTGKIPVSLNNLSNLQFLEFFNNKIDSVPDLSGLTLTANRLRMENNRLTFDDILPNFGGALGDNYFPQDSVGNAYTVNLVSGSNYTIDLGFDKGVSSSTYTWFKDGIQIATTSVNKLNISPVSFADAGVYRCRVTNSIATKLTLEVRPITINVSCGLSINDFRDSLCIGETRSLGGMTYTQANPSDTIFLANSTADGCDSVIYVQLYYPTEEAIEDYRDTICTGDTIYVNNEAFHANHRVGFYFFPEGSSFGCDSILNVFIDLFPASSPGQFNTTICRGDTLEFMGQFFYEGKTSGTALLPDPDINGCDSTVNVSVNFYPKAEKTFNQTLCLDDSLTINGTIYHAGNPSGRDTLFNSSIHNCDSIIIVDLSFNTFATGTFEATLCPGDSIVINGVTYNKTNPTGMDTIPNGSVTFCDSITAIGIDFYPEATGTYAPTICPEDDVTVNGTVYNKSNPKDTLYFTNSNGCDSTLIVDLQFFVKAESSISPDLCPGDSVIVNGTVYNESRPSGIEVISNITANGCDSTVNIDLHFFAEAIGNISPTLCREDSLLINGNYYHFNNPTGTERISGVGPNGCDSILQINLDFYPRIEGSLTLEICEGTCLDFNGHTYCIGDPDRTEVLPNAAANGCDSFVLVNVVEIPEVEDAISMSLCPGDSLLFNGTYYHDGNRTGTERIPGVAPNGCDSVIFVSVSFYDTVQTNFNGALCFGESITINGKVFDQDTTSGTVIFENMTVNGCDSIVHVDLEFMNFALERFEPTLCDGDSIAINGTIYHKNNRTGRDTLPMASSSGCDSIIVVNIDFYPPATAIIDTTLCPGERLVINGIIYDESNPTGTDTLTGLAAGGCDSMVTIQVDYFSEAVEELTVFLCPGDSITIHDTIYHQGKTIGTHLFPLASVNNCDSTLSVNIEFYTIAETPLNPEICPGQTITINGKDYDQNNVSGRDTLIHPITGCDSILIIEVMVSDTLRDTLSGKWCFDQSIEINSTTYDFFNRTGTEKLISSGGCDSIITIQLDFFAEIKDTFSGNFCIDQSFMINGTLYDISNPTGTENMITSAGCDSTLIIDLLFNGPTTENFSGNRCFGESIVINGQTYDIDHPAGRDTLISSAGCDSVYLNIDYQFFEEALLIVEGPRCFEESIEIAGNIYDRNNPTDTLVISNNNGCDSTIMIRLDFFPEAIMEINEQKCFGDTIIINGQIYDQNHPGDTFTLVNDNGCDSLLLIHFDFLEAAKATINQRICQGEIYEIDGQSFTDEGVYEIVIEQGATSGCDSLIELHLEVLSTADLGLADAGMDQLSCDTQVALLANLPVGVTGVWSTPGDAEITDINAPVTMVENLASGENLLVWTLSSPECPNYSADTLLIEVEPLPEVNDDQFFLSHLETYADLDILENDFLDGETDWVVELQNLPADGSYVLNGEVVEFATNGFGGELQFEYLLCSENCPDRCATAQVNILVETLPITIDTTVSIPNGITPNGDGRNDLFVIDILVTNPEDYPNNELVIFNRWGDIVYQASPYLNDWDGKNKAGKDLPQGTYYYVLRLKLETGKIFKGDVTILK